MLTHRCNKRSQIIDDNIPEYRKKKFNNLLASLTDDIALQAPGEYLVDDAITVVRVVLDDERRGLRVLLAVPVQYVQGGDEELVRILLLVSGEMARMCPDEVEQFMEDQRRLVARVELLEKTRDLADEAAVWLRAVMPIGQKVVAQQRRVDQRLDYAVHETSTAQVYQTT